MILAIRKTIVCSTTITLYALHGILCKRLLIFTDILYDDYEQIGHFYVIE